MKRKCIRCPICNNKTRLQILRKENNYSQEELAAFCNVSRQSISKWEADIALPKTEKLIVLSNLFQVTVDVLLKDELSINGTREVNTCRWSTKIPDGYFFYIRCSEFSGISLKGFNSRPSKGGNWFVDFKCNNTKYIVFKNKILKYTIGNEEEKAIACNECRMQGISDNEMNWSE